MATAQEVFDTALIGLRFKAAEGNWGAARLAAATAYLRELCFGSSGELPDMTNRTRKDVLWQAVKACNHHQVSTGLPIHGHDKFLKTLTSVRKTLTQESKQEPG